VGGAGSGNWYRFDKKTTTGEGHSIDLRYLHREGLLKPGHWFSLRWLRAGRETDSIRGVVGNSSPPESIIFSTVTGAARVESSKVYRNWCR
jgi:hypothetical protein